METLNNIILIGFKSCGKSTIAKLYAELYHLEYIDLDNLIIDCYKNYNVSQISTIYSKLGEDKFRKLESKVLSKLLDHKKKFILATGGGVILNPQNIKILNQIGTIIYLNMPKEDLYIRIKKLKPLPSIFSEPFDLKQFCLHFNSREDKYISASHYILNCSSLSKNKIINQIHNLMTF